MSGNFLVLVSKFNDFITRSLLAGAEAAFESQGISKDNYKIIWVPGCFELPSLAMEAAKTQKFKAIICLGAVIRGETTHYDYVAGECAHGVMRVSMETGVPTIFGVLTTENMEQALARCGVKGANKGSEAVHSALEMIKAKNSLREIETCL